eukprot:1061197-Amphidinium_carterae.2
MAQNHSYKKVGDYQPCEMEGILDSQSPLMFKLCMEDFQIFDSNTGSISLAFKSRCCGTRSTEPADRTKSKTSSTS